MSARLAEIRCHPIKGIGHWAPDQADVSPQGALHGDRAWALLTERAEDTDAWQRRKNFLVVANGPDLAPISAEPLEGGQIALTHPRRDRLVFDPETEAQALRDWLGDLWPERQPGPARLVRAKGHGMTDMPDPFVSIGSRASLAALSEIAGMDVDPRRFRINLWIDGWAAWAETQMVGQRLKIGPVELEIDQPIERCRAPDANPETGTRDIPMLGVLMDNRDTRDFGLYARVLNPGTLTLGDPVSP
ncbi:MAG: MOSC domain-containing protein [Pseudomonadota bacterium]